MSHELSPENEQFIADGVAAGMFAGRGEALDEAVRLLRLRENVVAYVDEGVRQLRAGECTTHDEAGLTALFNDLEAKLTGRYESP